MSGEELKTRVCKLTGLNQAEIAKKMGRTPQALNSLFNATDVRSGVIEEMCQKLNVPLPTLYGGGDMTAIAGDGSTSVAGFGNNVNASEALLRAIEEISAQRRVTETAQTQINKLIELLDKK